MAVLNYKKLAQNPKWRKLSTAARLLLSAGLAPLTDKEGKGVIPAWVLKANTGINSSTTIKKAREELEKNGFIKTKKIWTVTKSGGRKIPRSKIFFQITKNVLWKKDS